MKVLKGQISVKLPPGGTVHRVEFAAPFTIPRVLRMVGFEHVLNAREYWADRVARGVKGADQQVPLDFCVDYKDNTIYFAPAAPFDGELTIVWQPPPIQL